MFTTDGDGDDGDGDFLKNSFNTSQKNDFLYDPAISLLDIYFIWVKTPTVKSPASKFSNYSPGHYKFAIFTTLPFGRVAFK